MTGLNEGDAHSLTQTYVVSDTRLRAHAVRGAARRGQRGAARICMRRLSTLGVRRLSTHAQPKCAHSHLETLRSGAESFAERDYKARFRCCPNLPFDEDHMAAAARAVFDLADARGTGGLTLAEIPVALNAMKTRCEVSRSAVSYTHLTLPTILLV